MPVLMLMLINASANDNAN